MSEIRLVYFDIRGLAEPIRWILKVRKVPFEDSRIPLESWSGGNLNKRRSSPADVMHGRPRRSNPDILAGKFSTFIGQLPILHFDDFSLTQSHAVLRFIAEKYDFGGETNEQQGTADEVVDLIYDLRLNAVGFHGTHFQSKTPDIVRHTVFRDFNNEPESPEKETMRNELKENYLPSYLTKFSSLLEKSGEQYFTGNSPTYADLAFANCVNIIEEFVDPNCLEAYPNLKALQEDVCNIPEIKEFIEEFKSSGKLNPQGG